MKQTIMLALIIIGMPAVFFMGALMGRDNGLRHGREQATIHDVAERQQDQYTKANLLVVEGFRDAGESEELAKVMCVVATAEKDALERGAKLHIELGDDKDEPGI